MARYEVLVTLYDHVTKQELAQAPMDQSDRLEDAIAEFESVTDEDFEECRVDLEEEDEPDESDDEPAA